MNIFNSNFHFGFGNIQGPNIGLRMNALQLFKPKYRTYNHSLFIGIIWSNAVFNLALRPATFAIIYTDFNLTLPKSEYTALYPVDSVLPSLITYTGTIIPWWLEWFYYITDMPGYGEGERATCFQSKETWFIVFKSPCLGELREFTFLSIEKERGEAGNRTHDLSGVT